MFLLSHASHVSYTIVFKFPYNSKDLELFLYNVYYILLLCSWVVVTILSSSMNGLTADTVWNERCCPLKLKIKKPQNIMIMMHNNEYYDRPPQLQTWSLHNSVPGPLKAPLDAVSKKSKIFEFLSGRFWQNFIRKSDSASNVGNFYPDAVIWHRQNQNFIKFPVSGAFVQYLKAI